MELMKWSPMRDIFRIGDRWFDDFFSPSLSKREGEGVAEWNPAVDIYEKDDHIVVKAELPGVSKDNIAVDLHGRTLTIKGERTEEKEVKEEKFYRRESVYGSFERAFTLPAEVDPEQIKAEYKDGVLMVRVPKPEEHKPKQITVN